MPLFRTGFRMVIFSVLLMVVVLFYRQGPHGKQRIHAGTACLPVCRARIKALVHQKAARPTKQGRLTGYEQDMCSNWKMSPCSSAASSPSTTCQLDVDEGEIVALIGPNGAGKTTAFNVITGVYAPTNGSDVAFNGQQIVVQDHPQGQDEEALRRAAAAGKFPTPMLKHTPDEITKLGIARTFQNIRLFKDLTVFENVLIAKHMRAKAERLFRDLPPQRARRSGACAQETHGACWRCWSLAHLKDEMASSLPYGKQRRLEIARALATEPEPAAARRAGGRHEPAGDRRS